MKRNLFVFTVLVLLSLSAALFAAQRQDVVYLKNGSVIRGEIVEQTPNVSLKIETKDGSVFVYRMSEVEKITKEESKTDSSDGDGRTLEGNPEKNFALMVNPLGFLQFGPQIDLEIRLAPNTYLLGVARWHSGGLVSHLLGDIAMDNLAFGAGFRYMLRATDSPDAAVLGLQVQYGFGSTEGDTGTSYEWEGRASYIAAVMEFGYRWRFNGFIVQTGVMGGIAPQLVDDWWYLTSPSNITHNELPIYFFGMLELIVGFEF